jgi:hypothetical protein
MAFYHFWPDLSTGQIKQKGRLIAIMKRPFVIEGLIELD